MSQLLTLSTRTWTVVLVAISAFCAFALRLVLPYTAVFGGDIVAFVETDAWYHMRLVDALIRDFPNRIWFDPYLRHPGGEAVNIGPFFDWLVAVVSLLLGAGSPSERLLDEVGAFMPAVLGALTVVPVYVLGRSLFSRRAGLWSAAIVGVLPGDLLKRSLLGFTDHHCAEVLFSTLTLMFLVLALDAASTPRRRWLHAVLSGIALGCYLLTWSGGALLVAIMVAWATVQMVIGRLRGQAETTVTWACFPALLVAGLMILPWTPSTPYFRYQMIAIGAGVLSLLLLHGLAVATRDLARGRTVYFATLLVIGAAAGLLIGWLAGDSAKSILAELGRFSPGRKLALAHEAQPLMMSEDRGPVPLWNQFTTSLLLAVFAFGSIAGDVARRLEARGVLFVVWTGGMLLATIGQVRFSYYLAVNVALCAGYACDLLIDRISRPKGDESPDTQSASPLGASTRTPRKPRLALIVAVAGLAVLVVAPNASTYQTFASLPAQPNELWVDALTWLRYSTPDPFNDPELYYTASDGVRSEAQRLNGVQSAYGVLSWWDYGYWIIRIGRRVPIANPKQTGVREVAAFLLAEEESDAASVADSLGARYVIVNGELQPRLAEDRKVLAGFLENMAGALGEQLDRYIRVVYRSGSNGREPVILYEAPFYRTMMSRLYRTGHDPAQGETATWVVTLSERGQDGSRYWELLGETPFSSYEEAQAFVAAARSPNMRIVGKDPFVSCVPQQSLQRFVRVYRSLARDMHEGRPGPPVVQIFERRSDAPHVTNPRVSRINNSVEAPPQD